MKTLMRVLSCASILTLFLTTGGCAKAEFQQANLSISPKEVVVGESATVSIDVTNTGKAPGIYPVVLKVEAVESSRQEVNITPGETKSVSFSVPGQKPGVVNVDINGLTGTLNVLRAAEFKLENMGVSPAQAKIDEEVKVSINIRNIGEIAGTCILIMKTAGNETARQEVSLEPGASQSATFTTSGKEPGLCPIDINGTTGTFKVLKPASITTSNLTISPAEVNPGSSASVSVMVTNSGECPGSCSLTFTVDSKSIDTRSVTVDGGTNQSISFTVSRYETGNYSIAVGSLTGTLRVKGDTLPVLHNGDRWVYNHILNGVNYKRIETVTGEDVISGNECYQLKVEWAPLFAGAVSEMQYMIDKKTRENLWTSFSWVSSGQNMAAVLVSNIIRTGQSPWRLFVGNEWTETESQIQKMGTEQSATTTRKYMETIFKIEAMETITVPAGTFSCYKFVFYTKDGMKYEENWYSTDVKNWVKMKNLETGETFEMFARSVSN